MDPIERSLLDYQAAAPPKARWNWRAWSIDLVFAVAVVGAVLIVLAALWMALTRSPSGIGSRAG